MLVIMAAGQRDPGYYEHFDGIDITHAIYTHTHFLSRSKLFLGGGPLLLGVKGGYGAVWM